MDPNTINRDASRRKHTKSRAGCLECKKRKVKCDELHPTCRKCAVRNRHCEYAANPSRSAETLHHHTIETRPLNSLANEELTVSPIIPSPIGDVSAHHNTQPGFTALHMHLLYHAVTKMASYMALEGGVHTMITCALDSASAAPFVLDQLLGLAALHRSITDCDANSIFRHEATALQTRALSHFNQAGTSTSIERGVTSFLYVSLLGIHILRDTLSTSSQPIGGFITDFLGYMRIHRGVRVVVGSHWTQIYDADFQPLLQVVDWIQSAGSSMTGPETALLRTHLENLPDGVTGSVETCLKALQWVQWVINLKSTVSEDSVKRIHATMAWPLVVPDGYVDTLHQRRPEAIAVLAFFAATLHQKPNFWGFANAGPQLVRSIVEHVGPFWTEALIWPQEVVAQ